MAATVHRGILPTPKHTLPLPSPSAIPAARSHQGKLQPRELGMCHCRFWGFLTVGLTCAMQSWHFMVSVANRLSSTKQAQSPHPAPVGIPLRMEHAQSHSWHVLRKSTTPALVPKTTQDPHHQLCHRPSSSRPLASGQTMPLYSFHDPST